MVDVTTGPALQAVWFCVACVIAEGFTQEDSDLPSFVHDSLLLPNIQHLPTSNWAENYHPVTHPVCRISLCTISAQEPLIIVQVLPKPEMATIWTMTATDMKKVSA